MINPSIPLPYMWLYPCTFVNSFRAVGKVVNNTRPLCFFHKQWGGSLFYTHSSLFGTLCLRGDKIRNVISVGEEIANVISVGGWNF